MLIVALQEALSEMKTLRGFLPTCSHCKKIKDQAGAWRQIEEYIQSHTEATFSHGICPSCAQEHYGEYLKGRGKGQSNAPSEQGRTTSP
jgi:hypothetical protein